MTRLRRLRLLSGLRTGSSCRNCLPTCRRRPRCTRREREGRGTRGRLAGVGRRGRGGDIVECMHGDFLYGIIASQPAAVTARVLFPCRYLAASLERRFQQTPPPPAMSRLAKRHPDLLVSLPRVPPATTDSPSPELQLQPGLLLHRRRTQEGLHHPQLRSIRESPLQQYVVSRRRKRSS